jgi:hypothetical protein
MDQKTFEKRLEYLESHNLIISDYQGPFRPRHRYINYKEIQRVLKLQLKDLEKWEQDQSNKPESSKREYFIPTEYHLGGLDPWKAPLTPHIDTQVVTPLDAPIGARLVTQLVSITETNEQLSDSWESVPTDCRTLHSRDLSCIECDESYDSNIAEEGNSPNLCGL